MLGAQITTKGLQFYLARFAERNVTVVKLKLMTAIMAHTMAASRSSVKNTAARAKMATTPDKPNAMGIVFPRMRSSRDSLARRASWLAATAASNVCVTSIVAFS